MFCLTLLKHFVGETIFAVVQKFPGVEEFIDERGVVREYQYFSSNKFCLTLPEKLVGEPFSVSLISGIEKI